MSLERMNRREFLVLASTAAAAGLACAGCNHAAPPEQHNKRLITLGKHAEYSLGLTHINEKRIAILHDARGFACVSLMCTHQVCLLSQSTETEAGFYCPCHGSLFSDTGAVLRGPAEKSLPWYLLDLDDADRLQVDLAQEVGPDWRLPV